VGRGRVGRSLSSKSHSFTLLLEMVSPSRPGWLVTKSQGSSSARKTRHAAPERLSVGSGD
ncbi:mCG1042077, partial [Mus musculus]